jgi:hypothetical protein
MTVPHSTALRLSGDFTIEYWAKLNAFANSWPGIFKKGTPTSSGRGYIVYYSSDLRPTLKRAGVDGLKTTAAGALSADRYRHYALTYKASTSTLKWYVDGTLDKTYTSTSFASNTDSSQLQIGTADQLGDQSLDDIAFYSSTLADSAVAAHHDAGTRVVSGTVSVAADAADDGGVTKVEFYADGSRFAEDDSAPYAASWDTLDADNPAYDGVHELTARAYDTSGQDVTSQVVTVYVDNTSGTPYQGTLETSPVPEVVTDQSGTQDDHGVQVTVTNTSDQAWGSTQFTLVPRWVTPDPVPSFIDGTSVNVGALAAGANTIKTVYVEPPDLPEGVDRAAYTLRFDLKETATGDFLAAKGNAPADNPVIINKELEAEALGLERYYHYEAADLGAGMGHLVNVANGN